LLFILSQNFYNERNSNNQNCCNYHKQVSNENDRLGSDIESRDLDDKPCFIEVKSTIKKEGSVEFHLTSTEHKKALEKQSRYKIYMVYEANTRTPKIVDLSNPFINKGLSVELSPINYNAVIFKI
jgi:hypothetical protein